jgi:dTDP-4-dehydrorhamnose reductase
MLLLTGGTGLLGTELQRHREYHAPSHADLDVTDAARVMRYILDLEPELIVHCAGYTNVAKAETEIEQCYQVNAIGTRNVVAAAVAVGAKLVYLSTDYVFDGERGGYTPADTPHPIGWYATTKLLGEAYAHRHHIVRTSFKRRPWEHPVAVKDLWTSADYIDVIGPMIDTEIGAVLAGRPPEITHIGTSRKTILELARKSRPNIPAIRRADVAVRLPRDISFG